MNGGAIRTMRGEGIHWLEIHRPEKLNALDTAALEALGEAVEAASRDAGTRVLLLTGAGDRAFCAGADIAEMAVQDGEGIRRMMERGKRVARALEEAPQPVIAAVNGYALGGGCEMALACDFICASEYAQFGLPEVDLGILPGWGGSQRLERRVGYGRARDMILTGRRVFASEALSWGLCDRVFPQEELRAQATALARALAAKDPQALSLAKRALRLQADAALQRGLEGETELFVELFDRPERTAAMDAFLRRR